MRNERERITAEVRAAFAGVRLGAGTSLQQAHYIDEHHADFMECDYRAVHDVGITDDWTLVPERDLAEGDLAFLDAEALRFYLPALLLWMLDNYDTEDSMAAMSVIGTIMALAPDREIRAVREAAFDGFSAAQRAAVAAYVEAAPRLLTLRNDDAARLTRALDRYWSRFLVRPDEGGSR